MSDQLKQKTLSAIKWSAIDRLGQQGVQILVSILLARRLDVDVFGLIAMLVVFNVLSTVLIDSGFGQALIRKKSTERKEFNTIFLFNISIGVVLYLLLYLVSPAIARFYDTPELTNIAQVVFLTIPINALYLIPAVQLGMKLDFKSISKVNLFATLLSGIVALSLAFSGFEVWALVWQMLTYQFFRMVIYYLYSGWRPNLSFSFAYIQEHWKFSINLLGTASLNAVFNNIFTFIFGKFYSATTLGYYYQANKQAETVNYAFMSTFTNSSFHVFSRIQEDLKRLKRVLQEFIGKVGMLIIPVCFFLIFSAENLIVTLIGEKWLEAVPYFRLIVAANIIAPLYQLNLNAINVRGESKTTLRIELFKKGLILISILLLIPQGAISMIFAYAIISWLTFLLTLLYTQRVVQYRLKEQVTDLFPGIFTGLVVALATYLLDLLPLSRPLILLVQSLSAAFTYLLISKLLFRTVYTKLKTDIVRTLFPNRLN